MTELNGKKVLVVGLGKSGVAAVRYCAEAGARVTATDAKPEDELRESLAQLRDLPLAFVLGVPLTVPADCELIVASPGVPADLPALLEARGRGVDVVGELELAVRVLDRPLIAVTGTNGKTTTTALIGHLLEAAGKRVCVAGNIGTPLLDVVDEARRAEVVVLEVSSFQIETTPSLAPLVAIWLNATPDHLDRHATFEAYVACKARLFSQVLEGGFGIYNATDEKVAQAVMTQACRLIPFDATGRIVRPENGQADRAWFTGGDLWVHLAGGGSNRYTLEGVSLSGVHNRENMLAALAACELVGSDPCALAEGLQTFQGLPHRMEFVGEVGGVRYYNDSKGTNIGATIRALEGCAEPVVLIAGGLAKGTDFRLLAEKLSGRVKNVVLIGEAAGEMERVFAGAAPTERAGTMEEAVQCARGNARPGDVVLLSPACASFDMFQDYADRGHAFIEAVRKLASDNDEDEQKESFCD